MLVCRVLALLFVPVLCQQAWSQLTITSTSPLPPGTLGTPYNYSFTSINGFGPTTWSVDSGTLPPGLSLLSDGTLSGTPNSPGTFIFNIRATDTEFQQNVKEFSLSIEAPQPVLTIVTPSPLPSGTQGVAYSQTLAADHAVGPVSWALESGSLPPGLALGPTSGQISGTPTSAGTFNFSVEAADGQHTHEKAFQLVISPPALQITTATLPAGNVGVPYASFLTASGGQQPYTFVVVAGNLPNGVTLGTGGTLAGTPTASGVFNFTARVADALGIQATRALSISIGQALTITTESPVHDGVQGSAYTQTFVASGGTPPYAFSVISGTLPPGLTLSGAGQLSGSPQAAGLFNFTVQVSHSGTGTASKAFALTIRAGLSITTTSPLPGGVTGTAYSTTIAAAGGILPYSFTLAGGALPAGISLGTAGTLSGTPTASGVFNFDVRVTDAETHTAIRSFSLTIAPPLTITTSSLSNAQVTIPYSATLAAQGGLPPYTWALTGGSLPPGFNLSNAGALTGTANTVASYNLTFEVTDSAGTKATRTLPLQVLPNIQITTTAIPNPTAGQPYQLTFAAEGGTPPYRWRVRDGVLPSGLALSQSGLLEGTVAGEANSTVTIQVTDSLNSTASRSYTITVFPAPLSVSTSVLPPATLGRPYNHAIEVTGGTPPYLFTLASGALPPGISLSPAGVLSGTPNVAGNYDFEIQVTDSSSISSAEHGSSLQTAAAALDRTAQQALPFRLRVNLPPIEITSSSPLPNGVVDVAYSQQLSATGGRTPHLWAVTSGALPPGLTLNETTGILSGTPTAIGTSTFTVQARDNVGPTALKQFTLQVTSDADLILSTNDVRFRAALNGSRPVPQAVSVFSGRNDSIEYVVNFGQPATWLTINTAGIATPSRFLLEANPAGLAAGTYRAQVRVVSQSSQQTIPVSVTLVVEDSGIVLEPSPQFSSGNDVVQVRNLGAESNVPFTATVIEGGNWLTVSPASGVIQRNGAAPVVTSINASGLTDGFYRGLVRVQSGDKFTDIPVLLDNTAPSVRFSLAPEGNRMVARQGNGASRPVQSFAIRNEGAAPVVWSASVVTPVSWLSLIGTAGTVSPGQSAAVEYRVDPGSLTAGNYYARIRVAAAPSPPQDFVLVLQVLPATQVPEPELTPSSLLFIAEEGGPAPEPQNLLLYTSSLSPVEYKTSSYTQDQSGWLGFSPRTGTTSTANPATIRVVPSITGLKRGVYEGRVYFSLSTSSVRDVHVVLIVTPPVPRAVSGDRQAEGCNPQRLVAVHSGVAGNFAAAAGWAVPMAVRLYDDCGEPVPNGRVRLRFSNGDPALPLRLTNSASALYSGTWVPSRTAPQMTITADVSAPPLPEAETQLIGSVQTNRVPILDGFGVVHQFDPQPGGPLAPGTSIQILGSNLASSDAGADAPLPTTLNGVVVVVGGTTAVLSFVSPNQINAQLPFELTPGTRYQVLVGTGGAITPPGAISINHVQPGVAANEDGSVIARHGDGQIVSEAAPALPGEEISMFMAGLGRTDIPVATGAASPADPVARPLLPVTASIDGQPVEVTFAALAPGLVGVYEVRLIVPASMTPGVKALLFTQDDREANRTTIPVGAR